MNRERGTNRNGGQFDYATIRNVWDKAFAKRSNEVRFDMCNSEMHWSEYGNRNSKYGWEIDHIRPVSKGGTDDLDNLQPLQWENNMRKGDNYPWKCNQ